MIEWLTAAALVIGTAFILTSSVGLLRLPDFYTRMHGPTKAATLGMGFVLLAAVLHFSFGYDKISIREVLATAFIFLTSPVSAHMLTKAARAKGVAAHPGTKIE